MTPVIGSAGSAILSTIGAERFRDCAGSHYWAREIGKLGHTMRLIPPAYVKPFVKRQKNDAADAEAICEAAQRPSMRFVPVKDLLRSWPRPFGGEGRIRTYDAACTA